MIVFSFVPGWDIVPIYFSLMDLIVCLTSGWQNSYKVMFMSQYGTKMKVVVIQRFTARGLKEQYCLAVCLIFLSVNVVTFSNSTN